MPEGRISQIMGRGQPRAPRGMKFDTPQDPSPESKDAYRRAIEFFTLGDEIGALDDAERASRDSRNREAQMMVERLTGGKRQSAPVSDASKELYRGGLSALLNGDQDTAEALWLQAIEADKNNKEALMGLRRQAGKRGQIIVPEGTGGE